MLQTESTVFEIKCVGSFVNFLIMKNTLNKSSSRFWCSVSITTSRKGSDAWPLLLAHVDEGSDRNLASGPTMQVKRMHMRYFK